MGDGFFRTSFQMSMVKMVEEELKMEVREDIRAANITANIIPLKPGINFFFEKSSGINSFDSFIFVL